MERFPHIQFIGSTPQAPNGPGRFDNPSAPVEVPTAPVKRKLEVESPARGSEGENAKQGVQNWWQPGAKYTAQGHYA